jgi:hypothetical protein
MDLETAKKMLDALAWLDAPYNRLEQVYLELSEQEQKKYKPFLGQIALAHFDMMMPIIAQHSELDPDGVGKVFYESLKNKYLKD